MWIHELKGTGDLDPFEQCSHRFISGIDDESIGYAAESLKLLRAEIERRTDRLKELDRAVCPDKRVTRRDRQQARPEAVAAGLHHRRGAEPVRSREVRQAGRRRRRVHHQDRPRARRVPDPGHPAARQGIAARPACQRQRVARGSASRCRPDRQRHGARHRGVQERGQGNHVPRRRSTPGSATSRARRTPPQVVRTYYLNTAATERVASRARALREAAGTLSGVALGEDDATPQRDVLADVRRGVRRGQPGMHWHGAGRPARRAVPRAVGRARPATPCGPSCRRPRRARVVVKVAGHAGPGLPPRRRRHGGERHMTRRRSNAAVTALTCAGHGPPLPPLPGWPPWPAK